MPQHGLDPLDSRMKQLAFIMAIIYIRLSRHCRVVAPLGGQQELPQVVGQSQVLPLLGDRHAPL